MERMKNEKMKNAKTLLHDNITDVRKRDDQQRLGCSIWTGKNATQSMEKTDLEIIWFTDSCERGLKRSEETEKAKNLKYNSNV